MRDVCRLDRVRELFVLCFVVGTVCFPFPKFALLFPDDFALFFDLLIHFHQLLL